MIDLNNKTILILGGMHALSKGIAERLQDLGAAVILGEGMSLDNPEHLAQQIAALEIQAAIISPQWFAFGDFLETTPADWDAALTQNFEQAVYASQSAARHLIHQGRGGRIILLTSVAGIMPFSQTSIVGTSLSMLHALAQMAAVDLGQHGITVNVVAAGWVEAEWTTPYLHDAGRAFIEAGIPLGRVSQPQDIGNLVAFLVSDLSAYLTGAILPVDGGYILTRSAGTSAYPP